MPPRQAQAAAALDWLSQLGESEANVHVVEELRSIFTEIMQTAQIRLKALGAEEGER